MKYDVAVIGGSLGGVQAALSALKTGKKVYLCEKTDWIGGQLTSQAVPPDEHEWIEEFGATQSYMKYRKEVRDHYRNLPNISDEIRNKEHFCPGNSWVSRIAHEPKVALNILNSYLKPYIDNGMLFIDYETIAVDSNVIQDKIISVTVENLKDNSRKIIEADYFLDATDCGDLLPVVHAEYRTGAESKSQTGEYHAPDVADPYDMQPITWVAALELNPDEFCPIEKPAMYDFFKELNVPYDDNKLFSWYTPDAKTHKKVRFSMFDDELKENPLGLWSYRRIIDPRNYKDPKIKEVTLLNIPQNDFYLGNVYEDSRAEENLKMAREQTLCLVYWLQNDAPRMDGGKGYPVNLRPDIMGTKDGLAKAPYIRESRRIVAVRNVCEQDVSKRFNKKPPVFKDSVGVGHYSIDIHMTTRSHTFLYDEAYPFEIPLSAMIPIRLKNLIPACKNIGCTHITNGCYRLHPVEWNIGEVAGYLASYCIDHNCSLREVLEQRLSDFQSLLVEQGITLHWDFNRMEI
jgi:hypothetical protein